MNHKSYHNFYHKFDHTCGLGVQGSYCGVPGTIHGAQGKLSWRTWHYPRVAIGSTIQGWPLSKGGSGGHYPRVATIQGWPLSKGGHYPRVAIIQGWIWGPLSKGGHYPRVDHGSTIQGWPLFKGWPLSKGWPCCRHQKRPFNFLKRGS